MAALKQQLQQKLQQKLSPQQIQLIRLLELTEVEFEERVQQELVDNPALEEGREESLDSLNDYNPNADEDGNPTESAEELSLGDYRTEDDIPDYRLEADNFSKDDKKEDIPFVSASSFHDYLESQLGEQPLDDTSYQIAQYIIGNIDDNGYLQRPIQAITDDLIFQVGLDVPVSQVEDILQMIQEFELPVWGPRTCANACCCSSSVTRVHPPTCWPTKSWTRCSTSFPRSTTTKSCASAT